MKQEVEKKLKYYTQQRDKALTSYMETGKQNDRLSAIRCTERVKCLKEIVELINAEK